MIGTITTAGVGEETMLQSPAGDLNAPGRVLESVPSGWPLGDVVVWTHAGRGMVGYGGWTVELTGTDRLRRAAALWRQAVGGVGTDASGRGGVETGITDTDSGPGPLCFVSSVFDEASPSPSILRIPAVLTSLEDLDPDDGAPDRPCGSAPLLSHASPSRASRHSAPRTAHHSIRQHLDPDRLRAAVEDHGPAVVHGAHSSDEAATTPAAPPRRGTRWSGSGGSAEDYAGAVQAVLEAIDAGRVSKVVVSRDAFEAADAPTCAAAVGILAQSYRDCWTFAVGGLIGSTPELLARLEDGRLTSRVLAGSLPRHAEQDGARQRRLVTEPAFAQEHALAVRSVVEPWAAMPHSVRLDQTDPRPHLLQLPNIHHLATDITGELVDPELTVLDLVDAIHPSAAVGGTPRAAALELIRRVETHDRGRYAGPVGWMDARGDGEIALALRCGQIEPGGMRLYAGGGIVAGADPQAEVRETVSKFVPMREALDRAARDRGGRG